ncbi:hypothetical protein CFP56_027267 [Quercus suber]|uniref:Uncharacterized protein n=1 Tax=Quercus suber TaxID=58331 RepID=A0AAW0JZ54_QUESU
MKNPAVKLNKQTSGHLIDMTRSHPLFKGQNVASEQLQTIPAPTFAFRRLIRSQRNMLSSLGSASSTLEAKLIDGMAPLLLPTNCLLLSKRSTIVRFRITYVASLALVLVMNDQVTQTHSRLPCLGRLVCFIHVTRVTSITFRACRVRPLVSGTSFAMNRTPKHDMLPYMKNVPVIACIKQSSVFTRIPRRETVKMRDKEASPAGLHSTRKLNVNETSQVQNQLTALQMLPAEPFIFIGNI